MRFEKEEVKGDAEKKKKKEEEEEDDAEKKGLIYLLQSKKKNRHKQRTHPSDQAAEVVQLVRLTAG